MEAGYKDKRTMRRDARERRDALIDAAAHCFGESGYLVPLDDIAKRAGVGRGTLYRNFPDRMALALAVFDRHVDTLERELHPAMSIEAALATYLRRGALGSALFARLAAEMPMTAANIAALSRIADRSRQIIAPVVDRARDTGLLAANVRPDEVIVAARMVSGLLLQHMTADETEAQIARGLRLVMDGLRPR